MLEGYQMRLRDDAYYPRVLYAHWLNCNQPKDAATIEPEQVLWLPGDPKPKKERAKRISKGQPMTKEQLDSFYK
jgi:hypothetical protein